MTDLQHLQREFCDAVFADGAPPSSLTAASAPMFDIHRSNTRVLLRDALKQTFPVVHALVGDDFFAFAAWRFITTEPPLSPALLDYGETFPAFLQNLKEAATVPYLADVARLEWALQQAYNAADAAPLTPGALVAVPPDAAENIILKPHPSLRFIQSSYDVRKIWLAHQDGEPPQGMVIDDGPTYLAIVRPHLRVSMVALDAAGFTFIKALAAGARFGGAAEAGLMTSPSFLPAQGFGTALIEGMFQGFAIVKA